MKQIMAPFKISEELKRDLLSFLQNERSDVVPAYLFFLERKFNLNPVVFVRDKIIYPSSDEAVRQLEKEGRLWRETEIKIGYGPPTVNEETKKIYICPFTGKVFGDNTHPNPQDAIYDWVSKCSENTERVGGVKVKRFFISEDPEVIRSYIKPQKSAITKIVYSSAITGKLFNSKESVIEDFKEHYLKPMSLSEVQNQNKYQLHEDFLKFIQDHLQEEKMTTFVEALSVHKEFDSYVKEWVEAD